MLNNIKKFLFDRKLKSDVDKNNVKRVITNLQDSKTIGIVFDATQFASINYIIELQNQLKASNKSVLIFGYMDSDDKRNESFLISNKDLNWYGYPTKKELFDFCTIQFDILLGIMSNRETPLSAIFANSKAKFRIGADVGKDKYELFDLIITTGKSNRNTQSQIKSIMKFIKEVNTTV